MIKTPQLLIMMFLGMLGIAMLIHCWGHYTLADIISDIVGVALMLIGILSFILYLRQKPKSHTEDE
jgi:hypothetical protein